MATRVSVSKCKVRGKSFWRVRWHEQGRAHRKFFSAKVAAETHAAQIRGNLAGPRQRFANLTQAEQESLMSAWDESRRRGVDLVGAIFHAKDTVKASAPIGEVITELIAVKRTSGLSLRYLTNLETILKGFAKGRERLPISQLTLADVERYLDAHKPVSRPTYRGRISTLISFAKRRGYYHESNPCENLEPIKLSPVLPATLTVPQVRKCLKWFRKNPRSMAWFILSTFAGLRPEEADRTEWSAINFAEGFIKVEAQTSKIRQRRVVYPMPMVFRWLKLAKKLKAELPVYRVTRIWDLKKLRKPLKLKRWPSDCTRHTAASMWLAHSGSAEKVATALGHSESILRKHYMALVTKADAEKFWKLAP
ncbi:MAG: hypothetical protein WCH99_05400 [Verrucomicrobiota bacterium]